MSLVLRVRIDCGILSGCVLDKTNDVAIQFIPIDGCVWAGACDKFGNETAVSCAPNVADKSVAACSCQTGYTLSGETCVASNSNNNSTTSAPAAGGSTTNTTAALSSTTAIKSDSYRLTMFNSILLVASTTLFLI